MKLRKIVVLYLYFFPLFVFSQQVQNLPVISVLDFEAIGLSQSEVQEYTDYLSFQLMETGEYRVINREEREYLLEENEFPQEQQFDEKYQLEIGQAIKADQIIMGSLRKDESGYYLDMKILNADSRRLIRIVSRNYSALTDLFNDCQGIVIELLQPFIDINGLVAYFPFNGSSNDESGNKYHGENHGATLAKDRFDKPDSAYGFDGVDDYIEIPDSTNLDLGSRSFTISVWIKPCTINNNYQTILEKGSNQNLDYFITFISGEIRIETNLFKNKLISVTSLQTNQWYHITVTQDMSSTELTLYINGIEETNQSILGDPSINDWSLFIGYRKQWNGEYFHGVIDDVRIYNRALSKSEVRELYNESDY